ncbi:MAG: transporter [Putridiphycobacter sp.]
MKGIVFVFLLTSVNLFAQTIVTDRPDQTESALVVPKQSLQIESGVLLNVTENQKQFLLPTNLFRLGLTKKVELRLVNQLEVVQDQTINYGFSDLEIGTKIQILDNPDSKTKMAFLSHLIMPTGSKHFSSNEIGTTNKLCISHDMGKIGLGYNLGYNYFGHGKGDFVYSISLAYQLNDKIGFYIEPYGHFEQMSQIISNFDGGFTFLARPNLQFDFSYGTGLNNKFNYSSIGLSWLIQS